MDLLSRFGNLSLSDEDSARIEACYKDIKEKIIALRGEVKVIKKESGIAFAGSMHDPKLFLSLSMVLDNGKHLLLADFDGGTYWQEWDYESLDEFENAISNYIAPMINRKVKTVIEKERHKYIKISRYYSEGGDNWVLIEENVFDSFGVRLRTRKSAIDIDIKSYK